jgi:hypothetical protein
MSELKFQSTTDKVFGEMILKLIEENNRLQGENNTLLKESIALSKENNRILNEDHAIIASIDENVRKIKINTN